MKTQSELTLVKKETLINIYFAPAEPFFPFPFLLHENGDTSGTGTHEAAVNVSQQSETL